MNFTACNSVLKPAFLPSFPLFAHRPATQKPKTLFPISCNFAKKNSENRHEHGVDEEEVSKFKRESLSLLQSTVTLTVISASLPKPSSAAAKVSEKRRSSKKTEALTPEELAKWGQGLPVVSDRLIYSEILNLRREEKLKHVIKPSDAGLRHQSEVVLAVLEDNKVVRIVLPSVEDDPKFWKEWDELQMNGLCINAYTPPLKKPETTFSQPYLSFLSNIPEMMYNFVFNFPFKPKSKPKQPLSKKALELKRAREALQIAKEEELSKLRKEREEIAKAAKKQKRKEARKRRKEIQKMKYQQSLLQAADDRAEEMSMMWAQLAKDQTFTTFLGIVFFWIFYQTVIVSYKKQKKDYDDRLKIEAAEAEERMRIRALEREMEGIDTADELEDYGDAEDDRYMKIAQQFMRSGARVKRARDRKLPQYLDPTADVKFTDVAGLGKIRLELEEIVKFFTHGDVYRRRGVKIPGGILLCGPPGVGKTLLAKAVAGEAGVNFFSISASQFVEMYVGVGASRVRALYQEARENAPSVVFIDELDAVGRKRGLVQNSGGQERDATLNQLLVSLDGFEGRGEVITIASTNRPDILDPALVRPGRFDRKIYIPKPGRIGRREILEVHARNKPMAPDVDFDAVAAETAGMAGAELANVIEIAALYMIRDGRKEITTENLIQAVEIEERGLRVRKERSPEKWRQMALYEASMAVVAMTLPDFEGIDFVTIAPTAGRGLGYVQARYKDLIKFQKAMFNRLSVFDHICVQLAPRAADELWNGEDQLSTIWAKAANKARLDARNLVLGCVWDKYYGLNNFWISERNNELDVEAIRILDLCYERTKRILEENRGLMNAVVDKLLEQKSLTRKELDNLVALHGLSPQPTPPSLFDIRSEKVLELQNILDNELALQGST